MRESRKAPTNTYRLTNEEADLLAGAVVVPGSVRVELFGKYVAEHGIEALIRLFSEFIGAANAVVENGREFAELHLIQAGMHPHSAEKINMPSLYGAMRGVQLANAVSPKSLCGGCAYRRGAIANQCEPTTRDAKDCADDNSAFLCHEKLDANGQLHELCAGHAQHVKKLHGPDVPVSSRGVFRCGLGEWTEEEVLGDA